MANEKINVKVNTFPGTFIDDTTFLDDKGNPYDLKPSILPPMQGGGGGNGGGDGGDQNNNGDDGDEQENNKKDKPKIKVDRKTGRRRIFNTTLGRWVDL